MSEEEKTLVDSLIKLGWKYAYVSGHGDSEHVFDDVGGKWLAVGDIEKERVLVPPSCLYDEPTELTW